ncbi:MAG: helix-turn-helix domain-containing protein [Hyphomonas sp.]|uniref:helix-turn-helix domain-containing protein n=1 Tax=Hyphomonas sp. TaxID=87 RepID=UPI003528D504
MTRTGKRGGADADAETYWILRQDQLEVLASTVRSDIIDHLVGRGPMSIKQLAASLGRQPSSIYYHMEMLQKVGLIVEAGTQVSNRRTEVLYQTPAPRIRMKKAIRNPDNHELIGKMVGVLNRQSQRDFEQGLMHPAMQSEGPHRNLGFFRLINRPSPESLEEINGHLDRIAEILWEERDMSQPLVALAWTLAPLPDQEDGG